MENDEFIENSSASEEWTTTSSSESSVQDPEHPRQLRDYDPGIPVEHTYLGSDLEVLRGRTMLDDGSCQVLPLLPQPGVVLVPGQTLPLVIFYQPTMNMLRQLTTTNGTFGVVCVRNYDSNNPRLATIGTTAEIFEYREEDENSGFLVKAKGRQRFRIIETHRQEDVNLRATVKILPEVVLPDSLHGSRIQCLDRYQLGPVERQNRNLPSSTQRAIRQQYVMRRNAVVTTWPSWVHRMYNETEVAHRIRKELSYLKLGCTNNNIPIPENPVELSFWVATTMALHDDQKIALLQLNAPIQRLRLALHVLQKGQTLCCKDCNNRVANPRDTFSMSVEGPQGTFVNPGGFVHEIITLNKAKGIRCVNDERTSEYSWFPGYSWTVAECRYCRQHMGWKFTADINSLLPQKFWGLCRKSVLIKLASSPDENKKLVI